MSALAAAGVRQEGCSLAFAAETRAILTVAEMVLRAALARDESRGPHLRFGAFGDTTPLPSREEWRRYIVISREGGDMRLEARVPIAPAVPERR